MSSRALVGAEWRRRWEWIFEAGLIVMLNPEPRPALARYLAKVMSRYNSDAIDSAVFKILQAQNVKAAVLDSVDIVERFFS